MSDQEKVEKMDDQNEVRPPIKSQSERLAEWCWMQMSIYDPIPVPEGYEHYTKFRRIS